MDWSLTVALSSLVVSAATLLFAHLRPPHLTAFVGPQVTFAYTNDAGMFIAVPVTFTNHGAATGGVTRAAVTLYRRDAPHERYFMQWEGFIKPNYDSLRWDYEAAAHALAVPGKSIVAKSMSFVWRGTSRPALALREGVYELVFHYWETRAAARSRVHTVLIAAAEIEQLSDRPTAASNTRAAAVQLDQQLQQNLFLNEFEHRSLLGKPLAS